MMIWYGIEQPRAASAMNFEQTTTNSLTLGSFKLLHDDILFNSKRDKNKYNCNYISLMRVKWIINKEKQFFCKLFANIVNGTLLYRRRSLFYLVQGYLINIIGWEACILRYLFLCLLSRLFGFTVHVWSNRALIGLPSNLRSGAHDRLFFTIIYFSSFLELKMLMRIHCYCVRRKIKLGKACTLTLYSPSPAITVSLLLAEESDKDGRWTYGHMK